MDWNDLAVNLIKAVSVPLIVVVTFLARKLYDKIPRAFIPVIVLGLGFLADYLISLVTGDFNPIVGALLGTASLWLREFASTLNEHGLDS